MWRNGLVSVIATVLASGSALAQTGTITGRVTSAEGAAPVPGVHVVVSRTGIGADTRDDGRFTVAAQPGTYVVRAARIGFLPDSATVSVNRCSASAALARTRLTSRSPDAASRPSRRSGTP